MFCSYKVGLFVGLQTGVVIQLRSESTPFLIPMHYMAHQTNLARCQWNNMNHTCLLFDCFCDCFVGNILRIFLEFVWKNLQKNLKFFFQTILLRFMLKIWQKMSFSKKFTSIYKSFYYLKTSVTMFNECFCFFFTHWINFKIIHMFP